MNAGFAAVRGQDRAVEILRRSLAAGKLPHALVFAGPAGIGKRLTRAELLESLLEPSRKVDPKFATWYVETTDGLVHTGLLPERSESEIVIRDAQGRDTRIPRGEIEQLVQQSQSLMPEQLLRDLSAAEAADLLAYLGGL